MCREEHRKRVGKSAYSSFSILGAQRAFDTVCICHQSLLHGDDLLQVMEPYLYDCSEWNHEAEACYSTQQIDDFDSKSIAQNADIINLHDQSLNVKMLFQSTSSPC